MKIQDRIQSKLTEAFQPTELSISNESSRHRMNPGGETHFRVLVVTKVFQGLNPVERHRRVYAALSEELAAGVHALTLELRTPEEWEKDAQRVTSPGCRTQT